MKLSGRAGDGQKVNYTLKAVLMGESTVGKTSIVNVANTQDFTPNLRPTVGAFFLTNRYTFDNVTCVLNIWDTAGQERYRALAPMYFRDMHIACIVYAIDSRQSFEAVDSWYNSISDEMQQMPMIYLIGNKRDLVEQRAVSSEEGLEMAQKIGATFCEISAAVDGREVCSVFEKMARDCISKLSVKTESTEDRYIPVPEAKSSGCC